MFRSLQDFRLSRSLSRWVPKAAAALLLAAPLAPTADAGDPPDLLALTVFGPGQASLGVSFDVYASHINLGGAYAGDVTVEIVLSADAVVDAGDTIIGSATNSIIGAQYIYCSLPPEITPGLYRLGMRVLPVAGEVETANNLLMGVEINVFITDLELDDDSAISAFARPTDPSGPSVGVVVNNVGSAQSILVYSVDATPAVPWLILDPPNGFAVQGEPGNEVVLHFDPTALEPGVYATTVRFQSWQNADDFVEVPVEFTIGEPKFVPGDLVVGQIGTAGAENLVVFDGIAGLRVKIAVKSKNGDLKPRVTLIDPDGAVEKVLQYKFSKNLKKRTVKLKKSGEYTMLVAGKDDTSGGWRMKTNRTLPKKARPHDVTLKHEGGGLADTNVLLLPGALLNFTADPNSSFAGPLDVGLFTPSNLSLDLSLLSEPGSGDDMVVTDLEAVETGAHRIEVDGYGGGSGEKVEIFINPFQPKKGNKRVILN